MLLFKIIVLHLSIFISHIYSEFPKGSLKKVHVVFRHGRRTPSGPYPLDPYQNETYMPYGLGELTNEGKEDIYKLGQHLRRRYNEFLGDVFNPDILNIQAVDISRTKMSALLCAAGLFPPSGVNVWHKDFDWQPITYETTPKDSDFLMGSIYKICPSYEVLYQNYFNIPGNVPENYKEFFSFLENKTGYTVHTVGDASDVIDIILTEIEWGLKAPEWCNSETLKLMQEIENFAYDTFAPTPKLKQLLGGPLLQKILSDSTDSSQKDTKMYLYSGHGETVSSVLNAMNVYVGSPPYAAYLALEIHNFNDTEYVKVFYRNHTHPVQVPGCEEDCTLKNLETLVQANLPQNDDLCHRIIQSTTGEI